MLLFGNIFKKSTRFINKIFQTTDMLLRTKAKAGKDNDRKKIIFFKKVH